MRILVIDDEPEVISLVQRGLLYAGYTVDTAMDADNGLTLARDHPPDLVVLDRMLPDLDGLEVCRRLRAASPDLPVLMLTAKDAIPDRVAGLEAGADDYVVKPFSPREVVARVRACLRRRVATDATGWKSVGAFEIDRDGHQARYRGRRLDLTRYEYGLLDALLARPGAIHTREQLMERVWTDALDTSDRTVDTHVKTLRAKLRDATGDAADPIRTHRGLGYSIDVGD